MGWPQIVILILYGLDIIIGIFLHNSPRRCYNGWGTILEVGMMLWLLWMGGFFS